MVESQKRAESMEFPGIDKSRTMQIAVFRSECWFKGAASKLDRIRPPPIFSNFIHCMHTKLVDIHLLFLLIFDSCSVLVFECGSFFHIVFQRFIEEFWNQRGFSASLFSHKNYGFFSSCNTSIRLYNNRHKQVQNGFSQIEDEVLVW